MEIIRDWRLFDIGWFADLGTITRPQGNPGGKKNARKIWNCISAFDIETSTVEIYGEPQSFMYHWQMSFSNEYVVLGRTWDEWLKFMDVLSSIMGEARLIVFDHNLSFEFQFIKGVYPFRTEDIFALDTRKILKCVLYGGSIEMRCSYIQTNKSLAQFARDMGAEYQKLEGDLDYSIVRYPWTELTEEEEAYCINDVTCLVSAIEKEMERDHDTLYTIPLTSTGYVRRIIKEKMRRWNNPLLRYLQPDLELYEMLHWAFRGGNTHANRLMAGKILHNVRSWDRSSSYPDEICNRFFPMTAFKRIIAPTIEKIHAAMDEGKAVLMILEMRDIKLKDPFYPVPYIPRDKCKELTGGDFDNGRVLSADHLVIALTDIDYKIITDQYSAEVRILKAWSAKYGRLPRQITDTVKSLYHKKTSLKGVEGEELEYMHSKEMINAVYGMMVMALIRPELVYDEDYQELILSEDIDLEKQIKAATRNPYLSYQWGVWITSWARWDLEQGIRIAGEDFVYADTDSVKFLGEHDFSEYNRRAEEISKKHGAFAVDPKGITHYMGVFEDEGIYEEFKTMGAKKYAYRQNGKLHVTISGVGKRLGAEELEEAGGLKAMEEGFTFKKAGGVAAIYNDNPKDLVYNGISITSNVALVPSEYTLGITAEYADLLLRFPGVIQEELDKMFYRR